MVGWLVKQEARDVMNGGGMNVRVCYTYAYLDVNRSQRMDVMCYASYRDTYDTYGGTDGTTRKKG